MREIAQLIVALSMILGLLILSKISTVALLVAIPVAVLLIGQAISEDFTNSLGSSDDD